MAILYPKDIIHNVLINEIHDIVIRHPYLAFSLICSGIEFLGKCIDIKVQKWDSLSSEHDEPTFDKAIKELFPEKYKILLNKYKLRDQLRNGFVHFLAPKSQIKLTQLSHDKDAEILENNHPYEKNNTITLIIEYFYMDFVEACKKVISMDFKSDKMNKPFLSVPD